jgi:DNA helicase-2/ATP-dependent DNA helicase PcrA
MLNKEQMGAACDLNGTSIIIAGAGTGKTQTLIHKLVNLINNGVDPARICLLTFTNDAAETMKARAMKLGAKNIQRLTACTYHSFCDRLMRQYNHLINQPNDYTILEPAMVADIVGRKLNEYKKDLRDQGIANFTAKTVAAVFSDCINHDMPLQEAIESNARLVKACHSDPARLNYLYQTLALVRENVEEYKYQKKLKDFDDLLTGAYKLLDNKIVRDMVNMIYQYILIDEYQDTNHIQSEIVHQLRDTNPNLVVVGDDFQSIYRFRGAEVENFTNFPEEFSNVTKHTLVQNYRSTQEILDLANHVMEKHAKFGFQKTLVTGMNKHGVKPAVYVTKDQRKESELAYALMRKYKSEDAQNGNPNSTVAVLYRGSNSAVYLEGLFSKYEIPYEKHGGVAFFDMECIQDVLSYLRIIANPFHELAWYRVLKIYGHIGDKRADTIASMSNNIGFLANIPHRQGKTKTATEINADLLMLEEILDAAREKDIAYDMLKIIIEHYKKVYERRAENNESMAENKDNVFEHLDILLQLSNHPDYEDLNKWLDATTLREVDKPKGDGTIILSTIHSAKGLEWDHVILLDCVDGIFPNAITQEDMDEELRCFYVAMTRAAETLDIICPECAMSFGKMERPDISPFLMNLEKGYTDDIRGEKNGVSLIEQRISECNMYADKYGHPTLKMKRHE